MGRILTFACLGGALLGAVGCGESQPSPAPAAQTAPATAPTDTADSSRRGPEAKADGPGTIIGAVTFTGTAPKPRPLPMDSDPLCVAEPGATSELLLVGPGNGIKNVFVYVKDGLGTRRYAVPATPVLLDQKGCRYVPHVLGVQMGQSVEVVNSDPTLHNVHALAKANQEFNQGQPLPGMKLTRQFSTREVMVPFKCDVHSWMNAWVGVLDHPYFAVTAADGSFSLKGLPPGTYTIEAWHETLGTQTQSVTIGEKESKDIMFTFKA